MVSKPLNHIQRFTPKKRATFLEALVKCGNVSASAAFADVSRQHLYQLRKSDPAFAAAWDEAAELGADALEDEARRRAHDGVDEPLTSAKGLIYGEDGQPMMVKKYSDTLLIFLLKGARPAKYRERVDVRATVDAKVNHEINLAEDSESAALANALLRRRTALSTGESGGSSVSGEQSPV